MIVRLLRKHILPILMLSVIAMSCLPEDVLTQVEPAEVKLVISSQIIPGDLMLVIVSRSFSALEGNEDTLSEDFLSNILVSDAVVTISWDDQIETLEPVEDIAGLYVSNIELDASATELRLDVFDPLTNDSVYAFTNILPRINLDSVSFFEKVDGSDTTQSIYFNFADPVDADNWYVINAFDPTAFVDGFTNNPLAVINGTNGIFFENVISDQTFDSTYFEREVKFFDNRIESDTVAFFFSNISEGYFRFLDASQRTGGIISSASSEPINFPTNIVGGLGYFNAHNPSIILAGKKED